ncbi:hypothetical protein ElyMa_001866900 [Elysia marginata]|uniref:Uncharacterized protein n=1 Tax=Elysia marginata TaxID=1093978 RepID=A0AAV4EMF6_9GAST|nr:hypothetical protein ElyMa_001866900 [Elysia marginata]
MSLVAPSHIRREDAKQKIIKRIEDMPHNISLKEIYRETPATRKLGSINPFYNAMIENGNSTQKWRKELENNIATGGSIIINPIQSLLGLTTSKRKHWVITNFGKDIQTPPIDA